jgi:hypothetical protein
MEAQPDELNQEQIKKPEAGDRLGLVIRGQTVDCVVLSANDEQAVVIPLSAPRDAVCVGEWVALSTQDTQSKQMLQCRIKTRDLVPLFTLSNLGQASGVECRTSLRLRASLKIELWRTDQDEADVERCVAVSADLSVTDISIRLASGQDLLEGTPLKLTIRPTESGDLTLSGIVRRRQAQTAGEFKIYHLGIEFVDMTEEDREKLIEIIMRRHPHIRREELL